MARWHGVLAAATCAAASLFVSPSHAACAAPIVNSPPGGMLATCNSPATNYSLQVTTGGVYWYVHCGGVVVVPTNVVWAPGGAFGAIPGGCVNAVILLRAATPGSNAVGQLL